MDMSSEGSMFMGHEVQFLSSVEPSNDTGAYEGHCAHAAMPVTGSERP
jgi:hypothetical protein